MKSAHAKGMLLATLLAFFMTVNAAVARDNCGPFGGVREKVCATSHIELIANPEKYEGRIVDFLSVVHRNSETEIYLYPFNESREVGVMADVIRLDESGLDALNKHRIKSGDWIRVVGRFKTGDDVEFQQYVGVVGEVVLLVPRGQYRHLFQREEEQAQGEVKKSDKN